MITRSHDIDGTVSRAVYSDCERYRYLLERVWEPDQGVLLYIMLNPSKATELKNDPTIERCERRARQLGFGGLSVGNLFAWRETHPENLKRAAHPVGPDNDALLLQEAETAKMVLCAWGVHGAHLDRAATMQKRLRGENTSLFHLGLTKHGHPRHPLYVPYATRPISWKI